MDSKQENTSKWLNKFTAEAKINYIIASLSTLISAACFVAFSWFLSQFAAMWLTLGEVLIHKLVYAIVFLSGRYVFAHIASVMNYSAGNAIVSKIKTELYPRLLHDNESDSISSTLLVTRASDDLKAYFAFFIPYALASVLVSFLLLIVCFLVDKWVALVLLLIFCVIPVQMMVIGVGAETLHKKHIDLFLKYSAVFYNRLHTIAEIVNLDNFKAQYSFLSEKAKALNTATTNVMRVAILSSAVLELFVTIAIAAIAIYLGMNLLGIMAGDNYGKGYDFQSALFLLMLAPYFFFYMRKFVSAYHDRNRAMAASKLLMPLFIDDKVASVVNQKEKLQTFEIADLSFAYPTTAVKVLHNIHLKLPQKGLVLVKGISGSGKSTLLKICAGSLTVTDAKLSVNGHTNNWSQQWLHSNSSYMNQFPFIFDGTLGYNVFLDKSFENKTDYPAFLDKILTKKEDGWQTLLSHNGKQLSGGEKQLITLARMMLHPRAIAILDEPTANLDTETIDIIIKQIQQLAENCLVIVAAHEEKFDGIAQLTLNLNWGEQMNNEI